MFKTEPEIGLNIAPLGMNFWATYCHNLKVPISWRFFFLKSTLTNHLKHSNRIRNDQIMVKILTLVQNRALGTGT